MKEYPILMSAPMVRPTLNGMKLTTRRLVKKWHGEPGLNVDFSGLAASEVSPGFWKLSSRGEGDCWNERVAAVCPYGVPGDHLWIRETFAYLGKTGRGPIAYRADTADGERVRVDAPWRPSIHMPRWVSRITLEITGVKVERLLNISEEDAIAEGLSCLTKDGSLYKYGIPDSDGLPGNDDFGWHWAEWDIDPRIAYFHLWNKINGPGSAQKNPWVWALTFKRVQQEMRAA